MQNKDLKADLASFLRFEARDVIVVEETADFYFDYYGITPAQVYLKSLIEIDNDTSISTRMQTCCRSIFSILERKFPELNKGKLLNLLNVKPEREYLWTSNYKQQTPAQLEKTLTPEEWQRAISHR